MLCEVLSDEQTRKVSPTVAAQPLQEYSVKPLLKLPLLSLLLLLPELSLLLVQVIDWPPIINVVEESPPVAQMLSVPLTCWCEFVD